MGRIPLTVRERSISFITTRHGLGNRIIPIGCILSMATELNYRPVIFWTCDEVVGGANFKDLFDDTNLPFKLVEGWEPRIMGINRSRKESSPLKIPKRMILKLINSLVMSQYDKRIMLWGLKGYSRLIDQPITDLLKYSKIIVKGSRVFNHASDVSWLRPAAHLDSRIVELKKQFTPNTVGVHIRGTDWVYTPPVEKIIKRMHIEVERDSNVKFFITSDGDEEGEKVMDIFGDRLIMNVNTRTADRRTLQGQYDAVIDLFGLAATSRIIGFNYSSFVILAAMIGNRPLLKIHPTKLKRSLV